MSKSLDNLISTLEQININDHPSFKMNHYFTGQDDHNKINNQNNLESRSVIHNCDLKFRCRRLNRKFKIKGLKKRMQKRYNPLYEGKRIQFEYIMPFNFRDYKWYKISIPCGHKYRKDIIINLLSYYTIPKVLDPIMYKIGEIEASFYVDDYKIADALQKCNITMEDSFTLHVRITTEFPQYDINDIKYKERLKQVISKRYVKETNVLDLSKFHQDPDLVDDYFCALSCPIILMLVLHIAGEDIPNLETLNLENNKLCKINLLNRLNKKFSKLKSLHISNNKIDIYQIDAIQDLRLEELKLTGNPICNKYTSQNDYICDIRKRFPKLLRLDDMELPQSHTESQIKLIDAEIPQSRRIFFNDEKALIIANQFLEKYFILLDCRCFPMLSDMYDKQAYFSMTKPVTEYFANSQDLLGRYNPFTGQKSLRYGRSLIVSFIRSNTPQTKHFLKTFTMDLILAAQTMIFITITGYFQELDPSRAIRHFNRTFIIVSKNCFEECYICNEIVHIQPSNEELMELSVNQQIETSKAELKQPNQQFQPETQELLSNEMMKFIVPKVSEHLKQQMIATLSQETNMKLEWSLKYLQKSQWNYNNALFKIQYSFRHNKIPSEAFKKLHN